MKYEDLMYAETTEQMSLPLFQPLRLWSPRPVRVRAEKISTPVLNSGLSIPVRTFVMKGGYISDSCGVRRMVIAGKIFKNEEH